MDQTTFYQFGQRISDRGSRNDWNEAGSFAISIIYDIIAVLRALRECSVVSALKKKNDKNSNRRLDIQVIRFSIIRFLDFSDTVNQLMQVLRDTYRIKARQTHSIAFVETRRQSLA
jgi:hypothetical protein